MDQKGPEFQDYQTTEYYRVTVKVKAKLDYPADKIRYKFEEKYCAIIIAGSVYWECNLFGRIIKTKSKGRVTPNKLWFELILWKADPVMWTTLQANSSVKQRKHSLLPKFISQKILGRKTVPSCTDVLSEDFKDSGDFISTCSAALDRVESICKLFVVIDENELHEVREQLEEKKILFSIFGHHNSGKSTLLNAMLGDELLPMNAQNETSVRVNMMHDPKKHRGLCPRKTCEDCPLLCVKEDSEKVEHPPGASVVMSALKDTNTKTRDVARREKNEGTAVDKPPVREYLILANIPILSNIQKPWKAYLVDNPGFDDAVSGITAVAEVAMKTASAYVYILDYSILQSQSDTEHFKLLYDKDPDIFSSERCRLVIAVTKFDMYYTAAEEHSQISEVAIKEAVCTSIKGATGSDGFPRQNIVPISGKMALYARKLSHGDTLPEPRTQNAVKRFLEDYKSYGGDDIPVGEDEATAGGENPLTIEWKTLERASGIQELEERMTEMMSHCVETWVGNITALCDQYLNKTAGELENNVGGLEKLSQEKQKQYNDLESLKKSMLEKRERLEHTVTKHHESKEYKDLVEACKKDIESLPPEGFVTVTHTVDEFEDKSKRKTNKKYTKEQFEADMKQCLADVSETLKSALEKLLVFNEVNDVRAQQEKEVGIAERDIEVCAERFCASEQYRPEHQSDTALLKSAAVADVVKRAAPNLQNLQGEINIPPPELSLWTIIKKKFTGWFGGDPETVKQGLRISDLSGPIGKLREVVDKGCKDYLQKVIVPVVAQHFYSVYCKSVQSSLRNIDKHFQERIKSKQEEQQKMKEDLEFYRKESDLQNEWHLHLKRLASHLCIKADQFKLSFEE